MLDTYIRQLIETHRSNEITVDWQGSEPTLMGVDFYRKAKAQTLVGIARPQVKIPVSEVQW